MLKLYVLIRDDMTEAQQAVQAGHAIAQFANTHPQIHREWIEDSNTLIYLSVKGRDFDYWKAILEDGGFDHSVFHEPELKYMRNSLECGWIWDTKEADTAIAVAPNWTCQYVLFKDLPLALQPKADTKKRWWQR